MFVATPAVGFAQDRSYPDYGSIAKTAGPAGPDAAAERTRQEVKMLDDLFKNTLVLIDSHYVKKPSDFPAATAAKALRPLL
jgi:hypothetical protein